MARAKGSQVSNQMSTDLLRACRVPLQVSRASIETPPAGGFHRLPMRLLRGSERPAAEHGWATRREVTGKWKSKKNIYRRGELFFCCFREETSQTWVWLKAKPARYLASIYQGSIGYLSVDNHGHISQPNTPGEPNTSRTGRSSNPGFEPQAFQLGHVPLGLASRTHRATRDSELVPHNWVLRTSAAAPAQRGNKQTLVAATTLRQKVVF